jgi:hypothetical protein
LQITLRPIRPSKIAKIPLLINVPLMNINFSINCFPPTLYLPVANKFPNYGTPTARANTPAKTIIHTMKIIIVIHEVCCMYIHIRIVQHYTSGLQQFSQNFVYTHNKLINEAEGIEKQLQTAEQWQAHTFLGVTNAKR